MTPRISQSTGVGCLDDNETVSPTDDSLCPISSRGITADGLAKPDLVAPGRRIVSTLAGPLNGQDVTLAQEFPDRITADRAAWGAVDGQDEQRRSLSLLARGGTRRNPG